MRRTTGILVLFGSALFIANGGAGCGGDDSSGTTSATTSGGTAGTAGRGGSAGTGTTATTTTGASGSTGSGGSTGTGGSTGGSAGTGGSGTDAGSTIQCGTKTCNSISTSIQGMDLVLSPCCPADEANACGANLPLMGMGEACITTTPGVADPSCPGLSVGSVTIPSCCRTTGTCGYDLTGIGLGCTDPTSLGSDPGQACPGDGGGTRPDGGVDSSTGTDSSPGTDSGGSDSSTTPG